MRFLHWLFHRWSKWSDAGIAKCSDNSIVIIQKRHCEICNKIQMRKVL